MAHKPVQQFNDSWHCDIWLVIFLFCAFPTESPSSRDTHLSPCTPCFTWRWVSACVAIFTTFLPLKHKSRHHRAPDADEELYCCQPLLAKNVLLTRKTLELHHTHTNTQIHCRKALRKQKTPKGISLQTRKKGWSEREESSPESWWIDECREGERVKSKPETEEALFSCGLGRGGLACWEIDRLLSAKTLSFSLSVMAGKGAQ